MSFIGNNLNNRKKNLQQQQQEQGEIQSSDSALEDGEINQQNDGNGQQIYDSFSSEQPDDIRIEQEKKKREDFWKARNQAQFQTPNNQENLLQYAFEAAAKTNKRMLILRKKNNKRIQQLQNMRMVQQPYLMASNTHYRGSINDYPIMTIDERGRSYIHPNTSLRVSSSRLDQFIQKNIAEQGTANYLNEVVKFQNFAYQHRKKRRQNLQ